MGNTSTKEKIDQLDGGQLIPHGIYTGAQDFDFRIVQRLIIQRKIAPFYKGLEECDDSEDAMEERKQQQQAQKLPQQQNGGSNHSGHSSLPSSSNSSNHSTSHARTSSSGNNSANNHTSHCIPPKGHSPQGKIDISQLYQGAIECPICFLYYPRNINRTRCCDKPICTECFVQIKRHESSPTETPACPYCVEPHFGVLYTPIPTLFPLSSPGAQSPTIPCHLHKVGRGA
ncbi:SNF1-interacting protein [Actinomortierella ambigua]|nr:SNF1-interacting protein [Actinomortierella ambigua]